MQTQPRSAHAEEPGGGGGGEERRGQKAERGSRSETTAADAPRGAHPDSLGETLRSASLATRCTVFRTRVCSLMLSRQLSHSELCELMSHLLQIPLHQGQLRSLVADTPRVNRQRLGVASAASAAAATNARTDTRSVPARSGARKLFRLDGRCSPGRSTVRARRALP